ncbi:MAG TPA: DUF805 domain-containing protein [Alphaproteobacteria bacterium]
MGSFSIWHWIILLAIFGVPLIAVALERSDRRLSRKEFLLWVIGIVAGSAALNFVLRELFGMAGTVVWFIAFLAAAYFYQQALVRRARDAGHGKTLAYLAIIPVLNIAIMIYLLIKPSQRGAGTAVGAPA